MDREVFSTQSFEFQYPGKNSFSLKVPAFSIQAGESISIVGPSGDGKTTLLRLMEGSLSLSGKSLKYPKARSALIYQDLRLVNERTALQNCLMGALSNTEWTTAQKNERALDLLQKLGLLELKDQMVSMLSGGQKQRVAIARALMSSPDLLLADEPFSHLDHETALETYKLIKSLQKQMGFAWVATIHKNESGAFFFPKTWLVKKGRLEFEVAIDETALRTEEKLIPEKSQLETNLIFLFFGLTALCLLQASYWQWTADLSWGELAGFFSKLFLHSWESLAVVKWGFLFDRLFQTMVMAFLGTVLGFVVSVPFGFLCAEGVSWSWVSRPLRAVLMVVRSVPALIWALFFVAGLGLGAVSGVVALAFYSVGYFSKLLYEGIEDLERKPFSALRQLGASRLQAVIHALVPTAKPLLVSSFIFLLEYNVRSASLLGIVGAGGIGQDLMYAIEWRDFATVFGILILLIGVVLIFDLISAVTRTQLKKKRGL